MYQKRTVTFACHTYGGHVRLPYLGVLIVRSDYGNKYSAGCVVEKGSELITIRRVGTSILPICFNYLSELVVSKFIE